MSTRCSCVTGLELIYTSAGATLRCPDCGREWIAEFVPVDSSNEGGRG